MKYRLRVLEKKLKEYIYVTFDDKRNGNLFADDGEKFMRIHGDKVI